MNNYKKLEAETRANFLVDRYKATCEMILQAELGIKFFESREGQELQGAEIAKKEILKFNELLRIKMVEKKFMESLQ